MAFGARGYATKEEKSPAATVAGLLVGVLSPSEDESSSISVMSDEVESRIDRLSSELARVDGSGVWGPLDPGDC